MDTGYTHAELRAIFNEYERRIAKLEERVDVRTGRES
jgi:hypothetical protein